MKFKTLKTVGLSAIIATAAFGGAAAYADDGAIHVNHEAVDTAAQSWVDIQQAADQLETRQIELAQAEIKEAISKLSTAIAQDTSLNFKFMDKLKTELTSQEVLSKLKSIDANLGEQRVEQASRILEELPNTDS